MRTGIKCSHRDFEEKRNANPDFFELIYDTSAVDRTLDICEQLERDEVEFSIHFPTSYVGTDSNETILLNVASRSAKVRDKSRAVIEKALLNVAQYPFASGILHAPTHQNFSTTLGLFEPGTEEDIHEGLSWLKSLDPRIRLENAPAAIKWQNKIYYTEPIGLREIVRHGIAIVLDTGHLFTTVPDTETYRTEIGEILDRIDYVHVATLTVDMPYDTHGDIFLSSGTEYPSLSELIATISRLDQGTRLVCEPRGGSIQHITNLKQLREILKAIPTND